MAEVCDSQQQQQQQSAQSFLGTAGRQWPGRSWTLCSAGCLTLRLLSPRAGRRRRGQWPGGRGNPGGWQGESHDLAPAQQTAASRLVTPTSMLCCPSAGGQQDFQQQHAGGMMGPPGMGPPGMGPGWGPDLMEAGACWLLHSQLLRCLAALTAAGCVAARRAGQPGT